MNKAMLERSRWREEKIRKSRIIIKMRKGKKKEKETRGVRKSSNRKWRRKFLLWL